MSFSGYTCEQLPLSHPLHRDPARLAVVQTVAIVGGLQGTRTSPLVGPRWDTIPGHLIIPIPLPCLRTRPYMSSRRAFRFDLDAGIVARKGKLTLPPLGNLLFLMVFAYTFRGLPLIYTAVEQHWISRFFKIYRTVGLFPPLFYHQCFHQLPIIGENTQPRQRHSTLGEVQPPSAACCTLGTSQCGVIDFGGGEPSAFPACFLSNLDKVHLQKTTGMLLRSVLPNSKLEMSNWRMAP